jgi:hypothetical protein
MTSMGGGPSSTSAWLFTVLDDLGLLYSTRLTPTGVPYAALQLAAEETEPVSVTVITDDGTLRVTAHDLRPQLPMEQLLVVNRRLPLARAYQQPDDGSTELALGIFIGSSQLSSDQVGVLLGHILESHLIATGRVASSISRPALPRAAVVRNGQLGAAIARRGHTSERSEHEIAVEAGLGENGLRYRLVGSADEPGWILAAAQHLPSLALPYGPQGLATLQRLQLWTRAGRYTLNDHGKLGAEVATPTLSEPVEELAEWTFTQATLMLQVAARHLGFASRRV